MVDECNLGVYSISKDQRIILKTPNYKVTPEKLEGSKDKAETM